MRHRRQITAGLTTALLPARLVYSGPQLCVPHGRVLTFRHPGIVLPITLRVAHLRGCVGWQSTQAYPEQREAQEGMMHLGGWLTFDGSIPSLPPQNLSDRTGP